MFFLDNLEKLVYTKIVENMYNNNIKIWNDFYPFEVIKEDINSNNFYVLEKNQIKDFPSIKGVGEFKITIQFMKEVSVDIIASVNVK